MTPGKHRQINIKRQVHKIMDIIDFLNGYSRFSPIETSNRNRVVLAFERKYKIAENCCSVWYRRSTSSEHYRVFGITSDWRCHLSDRRHLVAETSVFTILILKKVKLYGSILMSEMQVRKATSSFRLVTSHLSWDNCPHWSSPRFQQNIYGIPRLEPKLVT